MEKGERIVGRITVLLDRLAGIAMLAAMLLVVTNIILRTTVGKPILGTYEYVGFITAAVIALALAHCGFQNGHLAVGVIMAKFPAKVRLIIDAVVHLISILFLGLFSYHVFDYAGGMIFTGEVSPTTRTPFYPFVYLVAVGLVALCCVLLMRFIKIVARIKGNG